MAIGRVTRWFLHDPRIGWYVSLAVHTSLVVLLGLLTVPPPPPNVSRLIVADRYEREQELITEVLDDNLDVSVPIDTDAFDSAEFELELEGDELEAPQIDEADLPATEINEVDVASIEINTTAATQLFSDLPDNIAVASNETAGGSDQAVDRITDELSQILWSRQALVVWLFDESGSMKPDRERIRQRVERIYTELGIRGTAPGQTLVTSVASYGAKFHQHTTAPTSDVESIRGAIDRVPVDESGEEMMCTAIIEAIRRHSRFLDTDYGEVASVATAGDDGGSFRTRLGGGSADRRKMVLILVTDESGNRADNFARLEDAVKAAQRVDCRIYVLGREASFGHPYDSVRWVDPQSKKAFTVTVDRGPETPSLELLQTHGNGRRSDIFKSGFGPYEQSRLSRATGGIFFMLPEPGDKESAEQRGDRTGSLRNYLPSLQSREEYVNERNRSRLRKAIAKIIVDLDVWNDATLKKVTQTHYFPVERDKYVRSAERAVREAQLLVDYYDQALQTLENLADQREREQDRRWRANYDLLVAQITAYKLRTEQYIEAVGGGVRRLPPVKNPQGADKKTTHWRAVSAEKLINAKRYEPQQILANERLRFVEQEHNGTPWALRAAWELKRDYGYELAEHYSAPSPPSKPNPNPVAPPKL